MVHLLPLVHLCQAPPTCPNHRLEASTRVVLPATPVEATAGVLQHHDFPVAHMSTAASPQIHVSATSLVTGLISKDVPQHAHISVDERRALEVMPVLTPKLHSPMHDVEQVSLPSAAEKCRGTSESQALRDHPQVLPAGEISTICSLHSLYSCWVQVCLHISTALYSPPVP